MYAFDIEMPTRLEQVIEALKDDENQVLAGGQTLIPTLKARLAVPGKLISLSRIEQLKQIAIDDNSVRIGACTTHASVATGVTNFPALAALAGQIGDPAVRNRGTIGGSLANNDPSACYPAAALACGATIVTDRREIDADNYFQGMFETALEEGELITELRFSVPLQASYQKFAQPASRFALVGVFVARYADGVRVAVTGASEEGVFRWGEAEQALNGDFSVASLDGLSLSAEGMLSDVHGSAAYRAHLVKVMTQRAVADIT
ncbi:FAD binding domain-containing protein [Loktanella sp. S4079]|uniref:FAD binding domain-containing protein n=1 Tax=Loktanella sp. S4079 TaxID=579483 RepID=UPI0005FA6245|nr:xanthine dehydrogenase family protein subunit M [Loktanella sp. S4079]KJZ19906.1 carbon monoxide dehydrogenase [Loktanella sp. S4079]